jgi:lipopolysaccharide/colanic/teichoic acid biosynthesis glycosyltransferase
MLKRTFEVLFALMCLIVLAPVMAVIALLIKRQDGGPIFYRGVRVGKGEKPFRIFKFRTMVANAESLGGSCTATDDPRITPLGRMLRRYKLDELPQLINVLIGDMSFVGPRPDTHAYADLLTSEQARIVFSVRPGITDWATLWNSDEEAFLTCKGKTAEAYLCHIWPTKIRLQMEYVRHRSMIVDLAIIARTIVAVMGHKRSARGRGDPAAYLPTRIAAAYRAKEP